MEHARAFVQKAEFQGYSLHDHLAKLIIGLSKQDAKTAKNTIEDLSLKLKQARCPLSLPKEVVIDPSSAEKQQLLAALNQIAALAKPPINISLPPLPADEKAAPGAEGEEAAVPPVHYPLRAGDRTPANQDIIGDAQMLAWAGMDLGSETVAKISLAVRELSVKNGLPQSRFFGKILGTKKDYYIIECGCPASLVAQDAKRVAAELKEAKENKTPVSQLDASEPWGEGVNGFVYYVSNDPAAPASGWSLLPRAMPFWIRTARETRRFFTGDLQASVGGYPHFPWGEAAYLRAQIAQIASECTIAPNGTFAKNEEVEGVAPAPIKFNDEYKGEERKKPEDLWVRDDEKAKEPHAPLANVASSAANWQHIMPAIRKGKEVKGVNNGGRVGKWVPPAKGEDEEPNENDYNPEEDDEEVPEDILRGLEADKSVLPQFKGEDGEGTPPWKFTLCTSFGKFPEKRRHAIVAASSFEWPGALCVSNGATFCNIYIGSGHSRLASNYSPPLPPAVQDEFAPPKSEDEEAQPPANGIEEQKDPRVPEPAAAEE